jgi:hypothetical protein
VPAQRGARFLELAAYRVCAFRIQRVCVHVCVQDTHTLYALGRTHAVCRLFFGSTHASHTIWTMAERTPPLHRPHTRRERLSIGHTHGEKASPSATHTERTPLHRPHTRREGLSIGHTHASHTLCMAAYTRCGGRDQRAAHGDCYTCPGCRTEAADAGRSLGQHPPAGPQGCSQDIAADAGRSLGPQ